MKITSKDVPPAFLQTIADCQQIQTTHDICERWIVLHRMALETAVQSATHPEWRYHPETGGIIHAIESVQREMNALHVAPYTTWLDSRKAKYWTDRFWLYLGYWLRLQAWLLLSQCPPFGRNFLAGFRGRQLDGAFEQGPGFREFIKNFSAQPYKVRQTFMRFAEREYKRPHNAKVTVWLFLVWPIVLEYGWRKVDVWHVAAGLFGNMGTLKSGILADSEQGREAMGKHIERLGLRLSNHTPGRRSKFLPQMAEVACEIRMPALGIGNGDKRISLPVGI